MVSGKHLLDQVGLLAPMSCDPTPHVNTLGFTRSLDAHPSQQTDFLDTLCNVADPADSVLLVCGQISCAQVELCSFCGNAFCLGERVACLLWAFMSELPSCLSILRIRFSNISLVFQLFMCLLVGRDRIEGAHLSLSLLMVLILL